MDSSWREHLVDFTGSSVASAIATAADGVVYAAILYFLGEAISIGVAAGLGAVIGGAIHYVLSRFWVFERFDAPILRSAVTYFGMSWLAAVLHGFITAAIAVVWGAAVAWFLSKGIVWVLWTYPMSRFVVFGGIGTDDDD